jgi:hypothetical protein
VQRLFLLWAYQLSFHGHVIRSCCGSRLKPGSRPVFVITYLHSSFLVVLPTLPPTIVELPIRRLRLAFLVLIRWLPQDFFRLTLPLPVIFIRFDKPLCVFCFGI